MCSLRGWCQLEEQQGLGGVHSPGACCYPQVLVLAARASLPPNPCSQLPLSVSSLQAQPPTPSLRKARSQT